MEHTKFPKKISGTQQTKFVQALAAQGFLHGSCPPNLEKGNSYGSTIYLAYGGISAN